MRYYCRYFNKYYLDKNEDKKNDKKNKTNHDPIINSPILPAFALACLIRTPSLRCFQRF